MVLEACINEADYRLHKRLKASFSKMKEVNLSSSMKPWQSASDQNAITDADQIQATLKSMRTYFHQANPRPKGGALDMNAFISTKARHDDLMEEIAGGSPRRILARGWQQSKQKKQKCVDRLYILQINSTGGAPR